MSKPATAYVSAGDYRYSMEKLPNGTYRCERVPINDPGAPPEELMDWAQLPEGVRRVFKQVQNLAAD